MTAWFEDLAGPEFGPAFMWTVVVLGAAVVFLMLFWIIRRATSGTFVSGGRNRKPRLAVLDAAAVDARRRLVLIRRDEVEHLIMIGGPSDLVIEQGIGAISAETAMRAAAAPPPESVVTRRQPETLPNREREPDVARRRTFDEEPRPRREAAVPEMERRTPPRREPAPPVSREPVREPERPVSREPVREAAAPRRPEPVREPASPERREPARENVVVEPRFTGGSRVAQPVAARAEERRFGERPETAEIRNPEPERDLAAAAGMDRVRESRSDLDAALLRELEATLDSKKGTPRALQSRSDKDIDDDMAELIAEMSRERG